VFIIRASEQRSQHRNRQAARERLASMLAEAIQPPKVRRRTKPSRAAKRRRLESKRHRGEVKRLRKPPDT
jgi:ribosome-associated protein